MTITYLTKEDIPALQDVLKATQLFPPDILPDLLEPALQMGAPDLWLANTSDNRPIGFCYASPEPLTDGTWNMRAIAVSPARQREGHGTALVAALEKALADRGARLLIVDTSGTDTFAATRAFYHNRGYDEEARIRGFWAPGDDKVIFSKALN